MKNFVWGAIIGAAAMYLYMTGLDALVGSASDMWAEASRPPPKAGAAR